MSTDFRAVMQSLKRSSAYRLSRPILRFPTHLLRPAFRLLKNYLRTLRWRHHAYPKQLNWNWGSMGVNRIAVVNLLLSKFSNPSYLEIGCATDTLFHSVPVIDKTGVDPVSGGNVRKTSDLFFSQNERKFHIIFIDGLHTYEQVRRDLINSFLSVRSGGWIALHDMLPLTWEEQHIPPVLPGAWTGDVWKIAFELAETEGVDFKILRVDHGIGLIKKIEGEVHLKDLTDQLRSKQFNYYYENLSRLPIVDWEEAQEWLRT